VRGPARLFRVAGAAMPAPLPTNFRWRIVWAYDIEGLSVKEIRKSLRVGRSTVQRVLQTWRRSNYTTVDNKALAEHQPQQPKHTIMTPAMDQKLLELLVDSPHASLVEHYHQFCTETGLDPDISTICRAVRRLNVTRKRLRGFARARDAQAALTFKAFIATYFTANMLFFLDETSKNRGALRRDFGYALRGLSPIDHRGFAPRGEHCSSMCSFDIDGFVNWYTIRNAAFNSQRFLDACEYCVYPYITPFPGPRSVVILDNATPHKCYAFVRRVNELGGMVLFTPPYCFDCTPLDNGAFGLVKRYLQKHGGDIFREMKLEEALDMAFERLDGRVTRRGGERAFACFRACGYV